MTKPRLLLVDDDGDLAIIIRVLSRQAEVTQQWRADGPSAFAYLAAADTEPIDLVLLDVNLPGQSGIEFLRRLRSNKNLAAQTVALFCQPELVNDIAGGWAAGANYLVPKNLVTTSEAWCKRIQEILGHIRGQVTPFRLPWIIRENLEGDRPIPSDWAGRIIRAIGQDLLRRMGRNLLEAIIQRAMTAGFGESGGWSLQGGRLALSKTPGAFRFAGVRQTYRSVIEQIWCLYGSQVSTEVEAMLHSTLQ